MDEPLGNQDLTWLTFDAPQVSPELLIESSGDESFFWDDGTTITVGVGVAARATGRGPGRWRQVRRQAETIFGRLTERIEADSGSSLVPRLYGGASFADDEAHFVLPRWVYRRHHAGPARIGVIVAREHALSPHGRRSARRRAFQDLERLALPATVRGRLASPVEVRPPEPDSWRADVEAALHEIASGRLQKVVAARPFDVFFDEMPSLAAILRALLPADEPMDGPRRSSAVRFAFRRPTRGRVDGDSTFLGLTPERLVAVQGRRVRSEALAGTAPNRVDAAEGLLRSRKDGHEHQLVVREIVSQLRPLCTRLLHDATPRLRSASAVRHLLTPIEGELKRQIHVLEAAERLHPTPAVCGLPTRDAARWIAEHEPTDRGWYTGAVGHFDAAGDGELRVALRCAELRRRSARVWTGAGLVAESDPDGELREITLKAGTMLRAFEALPLEQGDRRCEDVHLPFTRHA